MTAAIGVDEAKAIFLEAYGPRFVQWIDFSNDCWLWTGAATQHGSGHTYGHFHTDPPNKKQGRPHRMSLAAVYGELPPGVMVDHRYHCSGLCLRPDHLRIATNAQNQRNRKGPQVHNQLGVRGVNRTSSGRYLARAKKDGKSYNAGTFGTLEEAVAAVTALRERLYGVEWAGRP